MIKVLRWVIEKKRYVDELNIEFDSGITLDLEDVA